MHSKYLFPGDIMPKHTYTEAEKENPVRTLDNLKNDLSLQITKARQNHNLSDRIAALEEIENTYAPKIQAIGQLNTTASDTRKLVAEIKDILSKIKELKANFSERLESGLLPLVHLEIKAKPHTKPTQQSDKEEADRIRDRRIKRREINAGKANVIFTNIDSILGQLSEKINGIGTNFSEAQSVANSLYKTLLDARNEYEKHLKTGQYSKGTIAFHKAGELFKTTCNNAIKAALPILERDLGWGDYLKNMFKNLANAVVFVSTLGQVSGFFPKVESESAKIATSINSELQETDTSKPRL